MNQLSVFEPIYSLIKIAILNDVLLPYSLKKQIFKYENKSNILCKNHRGFGIENS